LDVKGARGLSSDEIFFAQQGLDANITHQVTMGVPADMNVSAVYGSEKCVELGLQFVNITAGDGQMRYVALLSARELLTGTIAAPT
jgi:hypothetical protein